MVAGGTQNALDGPRLCLLSRQLIFFYRQNVDVHRLVRRAVLFVLYIFLHICSVRTLNKFCCVFLCFYLDMAVPEPGEIEQSVCEAVGRPSETNLYFSDKEDLGLLLQVKYEKKSLK